MLNLNYNIIGSTGLGRGEIRQGATYQVRFDPYSGSIVLAMPGTLFYDGDYQNQFGMTNPFDDISAWVKGGPSGGPVGSNNQILYSGSATAQISYPSDPVKWNSQKYNGSTLLTGSNALVVNQTFAAEEGTNLTFKKDFVIEGWFAFTTTGSASETFALPNRSFAVLAGPGIPSPQSGSYIWQAFGGDIDPGGGINIISGSQAFFYDYGPAGPDEEPVQATGSGQWQPFQFNHLAVSYTSASYGLGVDANTIKLYVNGIKIAQETTGTRQLNQITTRLLDVMGTTRLVQNASAVYFQDFRMYNGTDKNYTGSIIPLPESIVTWG
jgi:hypothetical protein